MKLDYLQNIMNPGAKYLNSISGFDGTDPKKQIERTLEAQAEFNAEWEKEKKWIAKNKRVLGLKGRKD